jgi:hypothetical protein
MSEEVKFPGLYEELPFIAIYLLVSLKRDKAMFKAYSPVYDDPFIAGMEAQKTLVEELVTPRQLTGEMKLITQLVAADYTKIRNMLNRVESYINKATAPLTIAAADFGIRQVRLELEAKNDEGIVMQLRALHRNLESNKTALEPKGYTVAISTEFAALIPSLTTNSTTQNLKKDNRKELTRENIAEMNKLWKMMNEVLEDGKKIAREQKNDAMLGDYTFKYIQKKVRQDRKAKEGGTTPAVA